MNTNKIPVHMASLQTIELCLKSRSAVFLRWPRDGVFSAVHPDLAEAITDEECQHEVDALPTRRRHPRVLLDIQTANAVMGLYRAVTPANAEKLARMIARGPTNFMKVVDLAWKCCS